jgi:hypothetical protein
MLYKRPKTALSSVSTFQQYTANIFQTPTHVGGMLYYAFMSLSVSLPTSRQPY